MSKAEPDGSFWKSLGGILTGIAAIMTATGGLIGIWYQLDSATGPTRTPPPPPTVPLPPQQGREGTVTGPTRGLPEDVHASRQTSKSLPTIVAASAAHAGRLEKGDAVLAEWKGDGCLYPGEVRDIEDERYLVYFAFDEESWIRPESLVKGSTPAAAAVTPGTRVYAEVEDVRTRWIPSRVRDVRDGRYYVVFDESVECRPRDKGHVWTGIDGIVVAD